MTARVFLRNCVYMAQDLKACLFPAQLVDAMRGRDFDAAGRAADALNEFEAGNDGLDGGELPDAPGPRPAWVDTSPMLTIASINALSQQIPDGEWWRYSLCLQTEGRYIWFDDESLTPIDPLAASAPNPRSDVAGVGPAAGSSPRPAAGLPNRPYPAGMSPSAERLARYLHTAMHNNGFDMQETAEALLSEFRIRTK